MSTRLDRSGLADGPAERFSTLIPTASGIGGNTDVTECDQEPIHIPGSIQPHGAMLVLDRDGATVEGASANAAHFVGSSPDDLLEAPLERALGSGPAAEVAESIRRTPEGRIGPIVLDLGELTGNGARPCDLTLHRSDGRLILEIEEHAPTGARAAGELPNALLRLHACPTVDDLLQQAVTEVAGLTGFSRVMLYRFNTEGDGEVVAEQVDDGVESYLGLHYPGSDIPRQARELYRRQWLRLIVSSEYRPVPLLPLHRPGEGPSLDLSQAALRSVSPVHLQYLRNMGVASSMSMSVIVEDQLWGLILCHGTRAHRVPSVLRTACEQIAQFVSLQVESRWHTARLAASLRAQDLRSRLIDQMGNPRPAGGLVAGRADDIGLLDILDADAAAGRIRGRTVTTGEALDVATADRLVDLLRGPSGPADPDDPRGWHSHSLRLDSPAAARLLDEAGVPTVAGVLLAPRVGRSGPDEADDYLVWVRREVEQTVNWAGEPSVKHQSGTLSPRASFALWREKVRDHSEPWQSTDADVAAQLAAAVTARLRRLDEMSLAETVTRTQELFQREHEIADTLQRGMLPVLPDLDDLTLSASYVTAGDSVEVGGDWYDVFSLPDGSTGIAMGDVTGHDLSAAAVMGQLRSVLRSYAWEEPRPDVVLNKVDALVAGFAMRHLATVFFARLERDGSSCAHLHYANAGHLPPVLRLPDGSVELLDQGASVLIGVGIDIAHEAASRPIPAGSTLLLYTDGLVERRDRSFSDGIDELRAAVADGPDDADALRDHVLARMVPGRREDDIAVLVVRVNP